MTRYVVISPSASEQSALYLASLLGCTHKNPYKTKNYKFPKEKYDWVINYGVSALTSGVKKINKATHIRKSMDKITFLSLIQGKLPSVEITQNIKEARGWLKENVVVARSKEKGKNGDGVVFCSTEKQFDKANKAIFYTKYLHHTDEYRLNVWKGKVVSIYRKEDREGVFRFHLMTAQENHPQVGYIAKELFKITSLDWFGADLLLDEEGIFHVLETNSAPVLYPYTANKLVNYIKEDCK